MGLLAPEGRRDELVKTLRALLRPIRGSAGCLRCNLLEDVQLSNELRLLVLWKSHEDFERHVKTETFRRLLRAMELAAEPPELEIRTSSAVRSLDLVREILGYEDE